MAERRVLITGGCGFVGANLVRLLSERTSWSLRVLDDLRAGDEANLSSERAEVHIGSVTDPSALGGALEDVDAVVHLAGQTGVGPSVEDPVRDFEGNALAVFRVLETCRRRDIERFVFASSGAAVGDVPPPIHEEIVPRPRSPYGAGKLVGEAYCQAYAGSFGMATVALRFSNVYGPFSTHKKNAVPNFIKRCLRGEDMHIYGDGSKTRDFIYASDLCEAILRSIETDDIAGEVFQLATGVETSILQLAEMIREATGAGSEIVFQEGLPGEVNRSRAEISKARRLLGFEPGVALPDGLLETADWYRAHWVGAT